MSNYKEAWVEHFRFCMRETELNDEQYSDEEVLEFGKGIMVNNADLFKNMEHQWQYDMFFNTLIRFYPPSNGLDTNVDTSLFKNRAKRQTN